MNAKDDHGEFIDLDLPSALGADGGVSVQSMSFYIPNKDKAGVGIGDQRKWVLEAIALLSSIGGGATAMPPAEGVWLDPTGETVWDEPVIVYAHVEPERLKARLPQMREFLHRMGRETRQGEVAIEFNEMFYRIRTFDPPGETSNG